MRARRQEINAQAGEPVIAPPASKQVIGGKETSPELASLAGQYVQLSDEAQYGIVAGINGKGLEVAIAKRFFADVRRLAASVLAQTEPKP